MDDELKNKKLQLKAYLEKVDGKSLAVASEEVADRDGDVISIDGWDLKNYKANPVLMWLHMMDGSTMPIGRAKNVAIKMMDGKKKLVFEPEFHEITDEARTIKQMYEEGYLRAFSVGMLPREWEKISNDGEFPPRYKFIKQELVEISAVPIPALGTALMVQEAQTKGFNMTVLKSLVKEMKEPEDEATVVEEQEEEKPEEEVIEPVVEPTVESEEAKTEEVKEEAPQVEEEKSLVNKKGRVLSKANENKIRQAVTSLGEVLSALESGDGEEDKGGKSLDTDTRLSKIENQLKHLIGEVQSYRKDTKKVTQAVSEKDLSEALSIVSQVTDQALKKAKAKEHINSFGKGGEK